MIALTTPVAVPRGPVSIGFDTGIVTLGSCFSDAIGTRLEEGGFRVERNPFGTLYNPASIASALDRLMGCRRIGPADLVQRDGLYHSWHHHGAFSRPTEQECLAACNERILQAHRALGEASVLMVTFGTAFVFEHEGQVVANCHKVPAAQFVRRRMTVEEIVDTWRPLLQRLGRFNPHLQVVLTVSPIRHLADGPHGNSLSKSILLLATDALCGSAPEPLYFPAYEVLLDELRDYRYYAPDMAHPSPLAEEVVWERFCGWTMEERTISEARQNARQLRRGRHVPLH